MSGGSGLKCVSILRRLTTRCSLFDAVATKTRKVLSPPTGLEAGGP